MLQILLLMTIIPIIELTLLFKIHDALSAAWGSDNALLFSISTIVITGILGAKLARSQGFQVLKKMQESLASQSPPTNIISEGILILIGGILLMTPGYLTDVVGFLFLMPWTRKQLSQEIQKRFRQQTKSTFFYYSKGFSSGTSHTSSQSRASHNPRIIDVTPIDEKDK